MVNLGLEVINDYNVRLKLFVGRKLLDSEDLTIDRNLDKLCIKALDNLAIRNRIDRLSIGSVKLSGRISITSVSGMVLRTIVSALES